MAKNTITTENTNSAAAAYAAVGRRKRAIARVRLFIGEGDNLINGKPVNQFTQTINQKKKIAVPMTLTGLNGKYYFTAKVIGGGVNGQVDAVLHGLARCISKMSDSSHSTMAQNGLLTRDPREKERKKIYRVRARKMPQFAKR